MARKMEQSTAWTPNQIIAYRVAQARFMRGWTQEQASKELEPYLGSRLSSASFSAIERSFVGGRVRKFNADEILALARGFNLPIGWFFTPPAESDGIAVRTPDHSPAGMDPRDLLDAVLGNPESLEPWEEQLKIWPIPGRRAAIDGDGGFVDLGPMSEEVYEGLEAHVRLRAQVELAELLGDTDAAQSVLRRLADLLDNLGTDSTA